MIRWIDLAPFLVAVVAFAALVTVHVAIVFALARRRPRWHALVALLVFPAAPFFAFRIGAAKRASAWIALTIAYLTALFLASR